MIAVKGHSGTQEVLSISGKSESPNGRLDVLATNAESNAHFRTTEAYFTRISAQEASGALKYEPIDCPTYLSHLAANR